MNVTSMKSARAIRIILLLLRRNSRFVSPLKHNLEPRALIRVV
jgi:hypothetical protein